MKYIYILLLVAISQLSYSQLNTNLLLHYPMDNSATDVSGNGYDGIQNGVTFVDDRFGNPNSACQFDGIDDFIDFPNIAALKPDFPVSFSFWIKFDGTNGNNRPTFNTSHEEDVNSGVYFAPSTASERFACGFGNGGNSYQESTRRTYVSNSVLIPDTWHHVVIAINNPNDMKIYVDCIENGGEYSGTATSLVYSTTPGSLGRHDAVVNVPAYQFKGVLDDFRYWDRIITPQEIDTLCNNTVSIEGLTKKESSFSVYPNPSSETITLQGLDDTILPERVQILSSEGKLVGSYENEVTNLPISNLEAGLYFVRVQIKNGIEIVQFIKD